MKNYNFKIIFYIFLLFALCLFSTEAIAVSLSTQATDTAKEFVSKNASAALGVQPGEELRLRSVTSDGTGYYHVRFDSFYKSRRVVEGEVIIHVLPAENKMQGYVNRHRHVNAAPAAPVLLESDAEARVRTLFKTGNDPIIKKELVYFPVNGKDYLAWMVDVYDESGSGVPRAMVYIIDALSGDVLRSWNNLRTASVGIANTLYLGQVPINTAYPTKDGLYAMLDMTYYNCFTTDLLNRSFGLGTLFKDADNMWGSFDTTDRATAGTDAHLGMTYTLSYFKNVHGRNGIWDNGKGTYSRVHYGRRYNNAGWNGRCMTYGDGDGVTFSPLVALDVAAHELSHGVCEATANLIYSGQSGGLNESNSDIFAACVEFYINSIVDTPDWMVGEMCYTPKIPGDALRYMDDPTKDGKSIDHVSKYYPGIDVHYSSGVANNFFYLLSNGGTNSTSGISVDGIGISKAERIWYVALAGYMTSSTNFAQARGACLDAATQLFGAGSTELQRVGEAWTAVGSNTTNSY